MRRRARHCLKRRHWDAFERHVLRLVDAHAHEIRVLHRRIMAAPGHDAAGRRATMAMVDEALDRFLQGLEPRHVAFAQAPMMISSGGTASVMMHGLVEQALRMLEEIGGAVAGKYALHRETRRGLEALGLDERRWRRRASSRIGALIRRMPPGLADEMDARAREGDPIRREAQTESRRLRLDRGRHYVRRTVLSIEHALDKPIWDPLVARRLGLEGHVVRIDEDRGRVVVVATIRLLGFTRWEVEAPVGDHGLLMGGPALAISSIEHDAGIMMGRRIDRDARGLEEDDDALVAAPLVSALRWRERRDEGTYPINERLHLNEDVELAQGVVVHAMVGGSSWIDIPHQLPDTVIDGMLGKPITMLVAHPWLDPRMKVVGGHGGSGGSRLLVDMPVARLRPVDEADADPLEEWQALQRDRRVARDRAAWRGRLKTMIREHEAAWTGQGDAGVPPAHGRPIPRRSRPTADAMLGVTAALVVIMLAMLAWLVAHRR